MKNSKTYTIKAIWIVSILLFCVALILLTYRVTLSWFMDESVTSNGEPNINVIGTVELDVTTDFNFYNLALAPDTIYTLDQDRKDIATYVRTSYLNDVREVYVRVKYTYECDDTDSNGHELSLYFDGNFSTATTYSDTVKNKWVFNETDGYYYYIGSIWDTNVMFNKGYQTDNTFYNAKANAPVKITFDFEAIQRPYGAYKALWTTAPAVFNQFAESDSPNA